MSEIINRNITIAEVAQNTTSTGKQNIKIKDDKGLTYTLWPTKTNGEESKAYTYLKSLGYDAAGTVVSIGLKEEQGEYNGRAVTYRTIIGMRDADSRPQAPQRTQDTGLEQRVTKIETQVAFLMGKQANTEPQAPPPADPHQEISVDQIPF